MSRFVTPVHVQLRTTRVEPSLGVDKVGDVLGEPVIAAS
jgi:hypothetical protein